MSDLHAIPTPAVPRVRPEPRRNYTEGTPLTVSRQAHLQRDYTALGQTEHATAANDGPATASGTARKVYSVFSTVFCLSCCLLLV